MATTVRAGTLSARQIILGCNRLEISYLSDFSLYPPQRVELCDALQKLVSDIKNAVPYLHMSVEAETGNRELCISVNWELFRRMMLEAARMAAAAAARRSGTTVLGIALSSQEDMAVITLSENSYLLPDDDTPSRPAEQGRTDAVYPPGRRLLPWQRDAWEKQRSATS